MNKTQLKYFLATAECGSLNAASKILNISRAALSQQIKLLQEEFDTELFLRNGRRLELTQGGEIFYTFARKTLISLREAEKNISSSKQGFEEMLTIGCSETSLISNLSLYLAKASKAYPTIKFRVLYRPLWLLIRMMDAGEVDMVLSHHISKDYEFKDKYDLHVLNNHQIVAIVPPSLNFGDRKSISIKELDGKDVIMSEKHEKIFVDHLSDLNINIQVKCVTKSSYTKIELVKNDIGIAFVTDVLQSTIDRAQIKSYYIDELDKVFTEYIFYPKERKTATLKKFLEILRKNTQKK